MNNEPIQVIGQALELAKALPEKPEIGLVKSWLWITFPTKPSDETLTKLKGAMCFYSRKNKKWFCNGRKRRAIKKTFTWQEKVNRYGYDKLDEKEAVKA